MKYLHTMKYNFNNSIINVNVICTFYTRFYGHSSVHVLPDDASLHVVVSGGGEAAHVDLSRVRNDTSLFILNRKKYRKFSIWSYFGSTANEWLNRGIRIIRLIFRKKHQVGKQQKYDETENYDKIEND